MSRFTEILNHFFNYLEKRTGLTMTSMMSGVFMLALAALFTTSRWELFYHGRAFTNLSVAPFEFAEENDLRFRILSPLFGYLLYLRGPLFKYFMLAILALFFGFVYFFHRKKEYYPAESLGMVALMAFSTLAFYQLYFPAYTDPVTFLLMLVFMFVCKKRWLAWLVLSLMLFNHDNTLFILPFFFLYMLDGNYSLKQLYKTAIVFVCASIPYAVFRYYIATHTLVELNVDYYLDKQNMEWTAEQVSRHFWSGFFQAFRLFWIFPLTAIYIDVKEKRYNEIFLMLVCVLFVLSQLLVAHDISRLIGMSFPVIFMGAWRVRKYFKSEKYIRYLWLIIFLNLFVPSYYIGALEPVPLPPFWLTWISQHIFS